MGNFENIRPYAEFAHAAAQDDGIEKHLEKIRAQSYEEGSIARTQEILSLAPAIAFTISAGSILLWEGSKYLYQSVQNKLSARRLKASQISEQEKQITLDKITKSTSENIDHN